MKNASKMPKIKAKIAEKCDKIKKDTHYFFTNIKLGLLSFCHNYLNFDKEKYQYFDTVLKEFNVKSVQFIIEVVVNGFLLFTSLFWIFSIYMIMKYGQYYGVFHLLLIMLSMGIFSKVVRQTYKQIRGGYKNE